jgi:site-specific DNA-methyltransferase (adenine-specific)
LPFSTSVFDYTPYVGDSIGEPAKVTDLGALWVGDCVEILPAMRDEVVDTVFADPPFNLGKEYGERSSDQRPDYLQWFSTAANGWS